MFYIGKDFTIGLWYEHHLSYLCEDFSELLYHDFHIFPQKENTECNMTLGDLIGKNNFRHFLSLADSCDQNDKNK